jgi:hypothetical protein
MRVQSNAREEEQSVNVVRAKPSSRLRRWRCNLNYNLIGRQKE